MRKHLLLLAALLMIGLGATAQKKKSQTSGNRQFQVYAVGFYNQENLFDTCHDAGKNDYEYLPAKGWNGMKYTNKLKARNMQFCHIEGPDKRGIDCALLYNPALFTVKNTRLVPYVQELAKDSAYKTRGFLTVRGELAGEDVAVIVCHWPSRFSSSFYRESGARQTKVVKDSLLKLNPAMKVFVMGDMNDDPTDASMHKVLKAKEYYGVEVGAKFKLTSWLDLKTLGAMSEAKNINNVNAVYMLSKSAEVYQDKAYVMNMRESGTPLTVGSIGLDAHVNGWFVNLNANYYDRIYLSYSPSYRYEKVLTNRQAAYKAFPEIFAPTTLDGMSWTEDAVAQEKGHGGWMVDLSIGKSVRLKKGSLNFNLMITNLLNNQTIVTGEMKAVLAIGARSSYPAPMLKA
jgi:hypothetical protein